MTNVVRSRTSHDMRKIIASAATLLAFGTAASAAEPPYIKLARALGTPDLVSSVGPQDKSALGENADKWTKQTIVNIVKVPATDTPRSTLGVIKTFHDTLTSRHVHVDRFDTSDAAPYTCYFEYHFGTERDKGVAYSPHAGFVTIAQVSEKLDDTITDDDIKTLKSVINR
jgi:hypothetical protein